MTSKKLFALAVLAGSVGLTGCTQGFSASGAGSGSNSAASVGMGGTSEAQAAFKALQIDGVTSGLFGDGTVQSIELDKTNMMLIARIPVPLGTVGGIGVAPSVIPQIPGASIALEPTASGSAALTIRIPLSAFMKGVTLGNNAALPNGDPLPAIAGGELPALALNIPKIGNGMTLYLDKAVLGLFVGIKGSFMSAFPISISIPIKNAAGTRTWGYVTNVLPKAGYDGGLFLSMAMPDDIARAIDDVL